MVFGCSCLFSMMNSCAFIGSRYLKLTLPRLAKHKTYKTVSSLPWKIARETRIFWFVALELYLKNDPVQHLNGFWRLLFSQFFQLDERCEVDICFMSFPRFYETCWSSFDWSRDGLIAIEFESVFIILVPQSTWNMPGIMKLPIFLEVKHSKQRYGNFE